MAEIPIELPSYSYLLSHYRDYANPKDKIARECHKGTFLKLKRGLYVTRAALDQGLPLGLIANRLYGPSYISFVYALNLYSLIPESVPNPTSATWEKRRQKRFDTQLGSFFYRDIPSAAYPEDIVYLRSGKWRFLAASPEKALCDELSLAAEIRNRKALTSHLFENLRIDETEFKRLDTARIISLAPLYRSTTLDTLRTYLGG